ncbi:hypothetical protein [Cysteiniphilum marinum]|uniref:hypothetical protein n=1 Tax=Cysteiniphilum marinum TaxID=2774191 RepID=UPI00193BB215|nr:hypothetical protein [Cysteiniphilum marinum]
MSLLIRMFKYSIGLWLLGSVINVAAVFVFARACRQWNWLDPSLYRVYMPTLEKICGYWLVAPFFVFASIGLVAFVLWVLSRGHMPSSSDPMGMNTSENTALRNVYYG